MGIITTHLRNLLEKQLKDHGIVTWYDPEKHFNELLDDLAFPETNVFRYQGSFFQLRHQIEPFLNGFEPPRLLIYVPLDQSETHHALIEAEACGVVMKPGDPSLNRNTRLSVLTRHALKQTNQWTDEDIEQVVKDVEAGKYVSLSEIEQIAEQRSGSTALLKLIFGVQNPAEIALKFLTDDSFDAAVEKKKAFSDLAQLMAAEYHILVGQGVPLHEYRNQFARHILITDFITSLKSVLQSLASIPVAGRPGAQQSCRQLARFWRERQDFQDSYAAHATRIANEFGVAGTPFNREDLIYAETFPEIDHHLQRMIEKELLAAVDLTHIQIAKERQGSFWSRYLPGEIQVRWILIATIAQLLWEARRVEEELKSLPGGVESIFLAYTREDAALCLLDTYHRNLERHYNQLDVEIHETLEKLIHFARHRYMRITAQLIERFISDYQSSHFVVKDSFAQHQIYANKVKPFLNQEKIAYIWVDALRYEMARDLVKGLPEFEVAFEPAIASVPTVTEVGMAALLPVQPESIALLQDSDNKLAIKIQDTFLRTRSDRIKYITDQSGVDVFTAKLDDLLPAPKKKTKTAIENADLIIITSQEIDKFGEGDEISLARKIMDEILYTLQRALKRLAELGIQRIVIAADHGYLFGEEISDDMKIDAPGGKTVTLRRRIWVGEGGSTNPACIRAKISDFGFNSDLELMTPRSFAIFKSPGGARAYFHGGLSPQELIIPVITLIPKKIKLSGQIQEIAWHLSSGKPKIVTRFHTVQIKGTVTNLFGGQPPSVIVEVHADERYISSTVAASYGLDESSGIIQLRFEQENPNVIEPNTVTLNIHEVDPSRVNILLLDAGTHRELARLENIPMSVSV